VKLPTGGPGLTSIASSGKWPGSSEPSSIALAWCFARWAKQEKPECHVLSIYVDVDVDVHQNYLSIVRWILRQGGPKMKASAAYPRGYAKRVFKLHKPFMVRSWNFQPATHFYSFAGAQVKKTHFLKNSMEMSVKKIQENPVRVGNLDHPLSKYDVSHLQCALRCRPKVRGSQRTWGRSTYFWNIGDDKVLSIKYLAVSAEGGWPWATVSQPWATPKRHGVLNWGRGLPREPTVSRREPAWDVWGCGFSLSADDAKLVSALVSTCA
jgi:hypothetical protein